MMFKTTWMPCAKRCSRSSLSCSRMSLCSRPTSCISPGTAVGDSSAGSALAGGASRRSSAHGEGSGRGAKLVLLLLASCGLACEALRDSTEQLTAEETGELTGDPRGKTVAVLGDYDGCFDIISPTNTLAKEILEDKAVNNSKNELEAYLEKITKGATVLLFAGSNRQSDQLDRINAMQNGNGRCKGGFEELARERNWTFSATRLQEQYQDEIRARSTVVAEEDVMVDAQKMVKEIGNKETWSVEVKKAMAKLYLRKLKETHKEGAEVYFFDDVQDYLDAVCKEVFKKQPELFPNEPVFKTHIVHFAWYGGGGFLSWFGFGRRGLQAKQCTW
mmetsp:Transcript_27236/g.63457  ORF Transcript_27236/g.63457 Transcript_27236/m.63457 type:complete len:332 (+) Transcript_27236:601-1596(+)